MSKEITISVSEEVYDRLVGLKLRYYPNEDVPFIARKLMGLGIATAEDVDGPTILDMLTAVVWDRFIELNRTSKDSPENRTMRLIGKMNATLENIVTVMNDLDGVISRFIPEQIAVRRPIAQPLARVGIGQALDDSRRYPSVGKLQLDDWDPGKMAPKPSRRLKSLDFIKITEPKKPATATATATDTAEPIETDKQDMDLEYT